MTQIAGVSQPGASWGETEGIALCACGKPRSLWPDLYTRPGYEPPAQCFYCRARGNPYHARPEVEAPAMAPPKVRAGAPFRRMTSMEQVETVLLAWIESHQRVPMHSEFVEDPTLPSDNAIRRFFETTQRMYRLVAGGKYSAAYLAQLAKTRVRTARQHSEIVGRIE